MGCRRPRAGSRRTPRSRVLIERALLLPHRRLRKGEHGAEIRLRATMDTEAELARLAAAFFAAVSFEEGGQPGYDAIRDLFIDARAADPQHGRRARGHHRRGVHRPARGALRVGRAHLLLRGRARGGQPGLRDRRAPLVHLREAGRAERCGVRGARGDLDAVRAHAGRLAHELDGVGRRALTAATLCSGGSVSPNRRTS